MIGENKHLVFFCDFCDVADNLEIVITEPFDPEDILPAGWKRYSVSNYSKDRCPECVNKMEKANE